MKKKNYIIAFLCSILGFNLIFLGTVSYYSTSRIGNVSAAINKYSFDIFHNDNHLKTINLYNTIIPTPNRSKNVIIPGDKGEFELVVVGIGSENNIRYEIMFESELLPSNINFYLDNKTNQINISDYVIEGNIKYGSNMTKKHTIYWEWPYDSGKNNVDDYNYQGKTFTININATGIQTID